MNFNQFSKISINVFGGIFLLLILNFALWTFNFTPTLAQDAIQCKAPNDPSSGINLNNNLRLINNTETLNDIYMGTGEIYFGSDFANTPYITKSGSSLSLQGISADVFLRTDNNVLFQTNDGTQTLAGIYAGGAPAAVNDSRFLIVNGKIEGWEVNGLNRLCVQGNCINSWPSGACPLDGNNVQEKLTRDAFNNFVCVSDSRCNASGNCDNVVATNNITATSGNISTANGNVAGKQLCIGAACIDSWAKVMSAGGGSNINMTTNQLTMGNGTTLLMDTGSVLQMNPGSVFKVCSDLNSDGDVIDVGECSAGQGVSKIIAGSGITISSLPITGNPGSGIGDVTISATGGSPGLCAAGFTRIGTWCLDTDGQLTLLRGPITTNDAQYLPVATIAGAKAVIVKVSAYANWRNNWAYACVIPGDQPLTSVCNQWSTLGVFARDNDSEGPDMSEVTVRATGAAGSILTRCVLGNGSCRWYLAGYID